MAQDYHRPAGGNSAGAGGRRLPRRRHRGANLRQGQHVVELAEAVALSPSPCLIRVKRLEKAGYIIGYNAHVEVAKLGETVTVFTQITLSDHHMEDFARFEAGLRTVDEVIECHLISGGYDYLVKFLTRGISHYQSVIEALLERNLGITKYFSYIVIKSPIVRMYYPLGKLFGGDRGRQG